MPSATGCDTKPPNHGEGVGTGKEKATGVGTEKAAGAGMEKAAGVCASSSSMAARVRVPSPPSCHEEESEREEEEAGSRPQAQGSSTFWTGANTSIQESQQYIYTWQWAQVTGRRIECHY